MQPRLLLAAVVCAWLPARGATAQDVAAPGFSLTPLPYPGQSCTSTFANGDVLCFDGVAIARFDAGGAPLATYATLPAFVFPSFVRLDAAEQYALVGENSSDQLWRLELPAGALVPLPALHFNFDAVQRDAAVWYLSAATCGFNCGTEIWKLDALAGTTELRARLDGPSGPVALDPAGNLYFASQSGAFPAPPGSTSILFLLGSQLAAGPVLAPSNAFAIASGFDGGGDLLYDASTQRLLLAENNYGSGLNRIVFVNGGPASSPVLVDGAPGQWISNLELAPAAPFGVLAAFQPPGDRLRYNTTDFALAHARISLEPLRPVLALRGPGASGAGTLELNVDGAPPTGWALFAFGPAGSVGAIEAPLPLPGAISLWSPLALGSIGLVPGLVPIDAVGHATRVVAHDGSAIGQLALQALLLDADFAPAATSGVALL
ncbi:MAG: hypothetical protein EPO68_04045 [Planctomycetota bacterium]|nr:MAG: hypothetical protein EPO68_04045 [Planctomycetota bacterium]